MVKNIFQIRSILCICVVVLLAGCTYNPYTGTGQYWQRIDTRSALYLQGAKAQQALEEDISRCVTEIEELVRLGAVRKTIPEGQPDMSAYKLNAGSVDAYWNVPQRFGYRYVDHSEYHDFDSCMRHKGWKRVSYTDYKSMSLSHDTFDKLKKDRLGYETSGDMVRRDGGGKATSDPDFRNLNQ